MLLKLRERMAREEKGFTLIELLVVMLIIGILAAIAIPTFFNQRNKANDSSAKDMAHTAQMAAETCATDNNGSYAPCQLGERCRHRQLDRRTAVTPPKPFRPRRPPVPRTQVRDDDHVVDRQHVHDHQDPAARVLVTPAPSPGRPRVAVRPAATGANPVTDRVRLRA